MSADEKVFMIGLRVFVGLFVVGCAGSIHASQFFEGNGLAIDGHDPVAYFTEQKPVKGSPEFRIEFEGSTFQFASAAHRDTFAANPEQFVLQYGGFCAYGMAKGYKAKIDPAVVTVVGDKLYFNYSEMVRSQWLSNIPGYIRKADANWPDVRKVAKVHE
jgi:YHS domain-containing protein